MVVQARKALHLLYRRIFNLHLPIHLKLKLVDHTILPMLTYACEILGSENLQEYEKLHLDFLRKITNSRKSTPSYMLYGKRGRTHLIITIQKRMINYWSKLAMNSESFSALVYRSMLLSNINFKWLTSIKSIFDNCGFSYIFNNQFTVNVKNIRNIMTQTLKDQNNQQWRESLNISNKGRLYGRLKQNLELSPYFSKIPLQYALPIYKLISCYFRFPIEVLASQGIPYNQRKCHICSTDIGDAYHYILVSITQRILHSFTIPFVFQYITIFSCAEIFKIILHRLCEAIWCK